jgi:uncharacterized OB-fold protein
MTVEPIMSDLTVEYYESLAKGRLSVQLCGDCGTHIMYPRYRCPECFGSNLGWTEVSGMGTLHSFTVLLIGSPSGYENDLPYAVCVVKLDEGAQLLGRLWVGEDGTWDHYTCEDRVVFKSAPSLEISKHPAAWFTHDKAEG